MSVWCLHYLSVIIQFFFVVETWRQKITMELHQTTKNKWTVCVITCPIRFQIPDGDSHFCCIYKLIKISRRYEYQSAAVRRDVTRRCSSLFTRVLLHVAIDLVNILHKYLCMHRKGTKIDFRTFQCGLIEFWREILSGNRARAHTHARTHACTTHTHTHTHTHTLCAATHARA